MSKFRDLLKNNKNAIEDQSLNLHIHKDNPKGIHEKIKNDYRKYQQKELQSTIKDGHQDVYAKIKGEENDDESDKGVSGTSE